MACGINALFDKDMSVDRCVCFDPSDPEGRNVSYRPLRKTFVKDPMNSCEDITDAFAPYYIAMQLSNSVTPHSDR